MEFGPQHSNTHSPAETESELIQRELEAAMHANEGRLGNAFRKDGPEFPSRHNYEWEVASILSGTPKSKARTSSQHCKSTINALIGRNNFSAATLAHLEKLTSQLEENMHSEAGVAEEEREAEAASKRYEQADLTGVYVYSLPTFLRVEQMTDPVRYWFKVGMTETSSFRRVREQARQTGLPEDPVIYRVFQHPTKSPRELEADFHNVLSAAGHDRSNGKAAGTEWFQTNLDLLDALADALGCTTPHINEDS